MLDELVAQGVVSEYQSLAAMTTYKVGGAARWYVHASDETTLAALAPFHGPFVVIGRGSNVVVADAGFDGLVVRLGQGFTRIEIDDHRVTAGGAAPLPAVARAAAKAGIGGLEWMVGVPGSVGGAVRMNAGCFGSDTASVLVHATMLDIRSAERLTVVPEMLDYGYRSSNVASTSIVTEATLMGVDGHPAQLEDRMREITRWRRDHQPGGTHNAGSVFKNPPGMAAGQIIDELGLKGRSVGGVRVSERHANFFVAEPGARAQDIYDLVEVIRASVQAETGIDLIPEMIFVGFA